MVEKNYNEIKEKLKRKKLGCNGREYTLYELCLSANNYNVKHNAEYRKIVKEKYEKIYNCKYENIPINLLKEVYGLDETFHEIWKEVPGYKDTRYIVSNLGRIKLNGNLVLQDDENLNGYLKMTETITGKKSDNQSTCVYKFIALAFLGDTSNKDIHHINNNGYDCRPENLILLDRSEHSLVHGWQIPDTSEDPVYEK